MDKTLKGLLVAPVTAKAKGKAAADEDDSSSSSLEGEYIDDAYDALKSGDRKAFAEAFRGAVEACVKRATAGDYDDDEE